MRSINGFMLQKHKAAIELKYSFSVNPATAGFFHNEGNVIKVFPKANNTEGRNG